MYRTLLHTLTLCASLLVGLTSAFAVDEATPTPTPTATATATPSACQNLNSCVQSGVSSAVASCVGSNLDCSVTNTDKLAVSAQTLADRAIALRKCDKAKTKSLCNACYLLAKGPLVFRYDAGVVPWIIVSDKKYN